MKRSKLIACTVAGALLTATAAGGALHSGAAVPTGVKCPTKALPLQVNSIAPATKAALAAEDTTTKPWVVGAWLATSDPNWGPDVKSQCGGTARKKTVVVYINLQVYKSASLSSRVDFVSRFSDGYEVWETAH
jgi:hypothetical protein